MATIYEERTLKIPEQYPEHTEYWQATSEGKLLFKHCNECNEDHYFPRTHCPHCMSENVVWQEAVGTGEIYSYSVMRHGKPYAIAFVTLDEKLTVMTNIVDCDLDSLQIGQRVKAVFKQSGKDDNKGPFVLCFTPL